MANDGSKTSEKPNLIRMKPSPSFNREPDLILKKMNQPNLEGTIGSQVFTCSVCGVKLDPEVAKGNFCSCCRSQVVFRKVNPGKNKSIVRHLNMCENGSALQREEVSTFCVGGLGFGC
jgi:hypothetical protein